MKKTLQNLIFGIAGITALNFLSLKNYGQVRNIVRDSIEISIKSQNKDTIEQITWFSETDEPLLPHYAIFYLDKKENKYKIDCYKKLSETGYLLLPSKPCGQIEEGFNKFYLAQGQFLNYPKRYRYIFSRDGILTRRDIKE